MYACMYMHRCICIYIRGPRTLAIQLRGAEARREVRGKEGSKWGREGGRGREKELDGGRERETQRERADGGRERQTESERARESLEMTTAGRGVCGVCREGGRWYGEQREVEVHVGGWLVGEGGEGEDGEEGGKGGKWGEGGEAVQGKGKGEGEAGEGGEGKHEKEEEVDLGNFGVRGWGRQVRWRARMKASRDPPTWGVNLPHILPSCGLLGLRPVCVCDQGGEGGREGFTAPTMGLFDEGEIGEGGGEREFARELCHVSLCRRQGGERKSRWGGGEGVEAYDEGGEERGGAGGGGEELMKELTIGVLGGFPKGARESLMHSLASWTGLF
jgi:hypothetical protein